ncbi:MAG: LssY C-terminal domain-containing protein [Corynebacterium sp.]|nr:LssY C-terminal domain-containing protein [Corynebacterium sp.]
MAKFVGGSPTYDHVPSKVRDAQIRRLSAAEIMNNAFFVLATILAGWLALVLLRRSLVVDWPYQLFVIPFWGITTYFVLPRMHRIFTQIYVPGYFIGRARTSDGLLGDPINLAFHGSAKEIHQAMTRAGWTLADDVTLRSSWGIIVSSILKRSYPQAPVSPLFVFGRKQCLAYQQEVEGNAAQRHHVRLWRCPDNWLLPGGRRVQWVAAGTYDRSVGLSLFTFQVTHKIDANIDIERDYIAHSLLAANPEAGVEVIENFSTGYHSRNGGGDLVITDGNLPIVCLDYVPVDPDLPIPVGVERAAQGYTVADPGGLAIADSDAIVGGYTPRLQRPFALVFGTISALIFAAAGAYTNAVHVPIFFPHDIPLRRTIIVFVIILPTIFILITAWFSWNGGVRARLCLMLLISFDVLAAEALYNSGEFGIAALLIRGTLPLNILSLLALSSPSIQQWSERKKEFSTAEIQQ